MLYTNLEQRKGKKIIIEGKRVILIIGGNIKGNINTLNRFRFAFKTMKWGERVQNMPLQPTLKLFDHKTINIARNKNL